MRSNLRGCSMVFFFFKQKTAYELRISDWSSDVCSSDLELGHPVGPPGLLRVVEQGRRVEVVDPTLALGGRPVEAVPERVDAGPARGHDPEAGEIGSASCRERVCQYV